MRAGCTRRTTRVQSACTGVDGKIIEHGEVLHFRDMNTERLPVAPVHLGEPVRS